MKFEEALKCLMEGSEIVREIWTKEDGYLILMKNMQHIWKVLTHPAVNAGNNLFSVADLTADDWKVFDGNYKEKQESPDSIL